MEIFGDITTDTQIGVLLNNVSKKREESEAYALYATFKILGKSVYCAFSVGLVDKDTGMEMETAVVEISEDEGSYIQPICIPEIALHYFTFDDIAMLSYWLGNFWVGVQYEMNNKPEEIRVIKQRESEADNNDEYKEGNHIVLVKKVIPVDENGNRIKYSSSDSNRHYNMPAWTVRGHDRTLPDGRVIPVRSYKKGEQRNNPEALVKKEFKNFPDLNLILLDGRLKTIYSIIEDIKNLPPNTVILFGTWKVDASNAFFIKNAIYTMSGVNPKVPVFSIISFGLNNWVLGGYSPNYRQQGPDMAKQAINIEKGEEANIKFIPNEYIFDFNKIKESDIPIEKLPRNSILLNKTLPLWKEYPVEFISIISVLIILVIALCCTLFFYFRTKKVKEHLEMSEKELIIAKDRAEESNRLKSAFLANMSHEIRTPLNAIVGFSTVLAEENKNKEQQEYLDIIQKNSDLLLRLINDILDLSRLESGRVQFNFSLCDITQLCRDQIAIINRVKKNAIAYIFEADEPLSMVTDPQRLQQIFINLLNNAGKFTDTGTITLS